MMTSTSAVSRDPSVSMSRDDDQAKAGLDTTLLVDGDTDPGTSTSRKELVKLQLDGDSTMEELRTAYRPIVICLKPELKQRKKVRGLWKNPPEGWPEDVSFRDPNNDSKRGKKPRMAELFPMYKTAVRLYKQKYPKNIPTMGGMPLTVDVSQPQRSVTGSSTGEHLETASGVDAFNKRQHQGTQPEESHMSTLCQPTLLELGIKPLGLGSPDASRNIKDRRDSDTEVNGNQGVMIAGGTSDPMVVKDVPRPQLQFGMETRMDEALDKYGQACDGVSPTLVSFQSQPPEAGHWDSAQSKTAAGGSDVTSLRQGKQPEASSMSACSELRKKRLGTGLPADCSANDRQHSNAEVNENQGVQTVLKESPWPGPGPQPQVTESEVTEDQVLEKYPDDIPTKQYQGGMPDVSQPQRSVTGSSTCEHLETASGGDAVNKRQQQGTQPKESNMSTLCQPTLLELGMKHLGPGSVAGGTCVPMVVKEGPGPGSGPQLQGVESAVTEDQVLEEAHLIAELNPAWMGLSASDVMDQLKLLDDGGAVMLSHDASQAGHAPVKSTGLSTGKDAMFSGQLQTYIPADNPLMDSFSNNNVSSPEEPQHLHVQNEPRKRKQTAVVESDSGQALPKRPRRRISESVTNIIQVPSATETQMGLPTTELTCNVCGNVMSECPDRFTHFEATLDV